jgi:tetratricopeptide (TPR) repeat protein
VGKSSWFNEIRGAGVPNIADSLFNLAVRQKQARQFDAALDSYQKALEAHVARPEEAYLNRSVIYSVHLGQYEAAERELKLALSCNPNFVPALLNLAKLHEDLGDRAQAGAAYAKILALDPCYFEALARYANMQPPTEADPQFIAKLRSALAHPRASAADRASLGFALGRLLDAAGEYPAAFAAVKAANRASRESVMARFAPYDRAAQVRLVDRLIAAGVAPGIHDPACAQQSPPAPQPRPIFICGMFRSGSTLAEQMLANYPGVVAGGELDFLPRLVSGELVPFPESLRTLSAERRASLAARYRAELERIGPEADLVTDKRPDNFLNIGLIKSLLPDARIVHTTRNPLDNCLSIYFLHLDQGMSYALDLEDIGHYYREYRRLMTHWKKLFPNDMVDFDYDVLVADPQRAMQRLCTFLGIDAGPARDGQPPSAVGTAAPAGRAVKTASVWQVREPLYQRSSGRAANYAAELQILEPYLSGLLP